MNSLERVFATIQGKPTDRRAATLNLSLYGARLIESPLQEYYTRADVYVEGQLAVKETFHPDILLAPFALVAEGEAFGSQVRYFDNNPPNMNAPVTTSAEELLRLELPDIESHPRLLYIRNAIQGLSAKCARDTALAGVLLDPLSLPCLIMGLDAWLETILFQEDVAKRILEMMLRFFVTWGNAMFADGAHILFLPAAFCNPNIVTKRIVTDVAMPVLHDAFRQMNGPIAIHHGGAPINAFITILNELPQVTAFVLDRHDSFRAARQAIGGEKVLLGNIDGPTLNKRSPENIYVACRRILKDRQDDPRFVLETSGPDVPLDTPPENIEAFLQAAREIDKEA